MTALGNYYKGKVSPLLFVKERVNKSKSMLSLYCRLKQLKKLLTAVSEYLLFLTMYLVRRQAAVAHRLHHCYSQIKAKTQAEPRDSAQKQTSRCVNVLSKGSATHPCCTLGHRNMNRFLMFG